jgi:hypothetical protein
VLGAIGDGQRCACRKWFGAGLATFCGCLLALLLPAFATRRGSCVTRDCCYAGPASRQLYVAVEIGCVMCSLCLLAALLRCTALNMCEQHTLHTLLL